MVLINGVKYACERCIRGHRVTTCTHTDQPLTMIKPKGRPASQCQHCRESRKLKNAHVSCTCGKRGKAPGSSHSSSCSCHSTSHCTCAPSSKPISNQNIHHLSASEKAKRVSLISAANAEVKKKSCCSSSSSLNQSSSVSPTGANSNGTEIGTSNSTNSSSYNGHSASSGLEDIPFDSSVTYDLFASPESSSDRHFPAFDYSYYHGTSPPQSDLDQKERAQSQTSQSTQVSESTQNAPQSQNNNSNNNNNNNSNKLGDFQPSSPRKEEINMEQEYPFAPAQLSPGEFDIAESMFPLFPLVGQYSFDDDKSNPLSMIPGVKRESVDHSKSGLLSQVKTVQSKPISVLPVSVSPLGPISNSSAPSVHSTNLTHKKSIKQHQPKPLRPHANSSASLSSIGATHYQPIRPKRPESVLSITSNSSNRSFDFNSTTNNSLITGNLPNSTNSSAFPPSGMYPDSQNEYMDRIVDHSDNSDHTHHPQSSAMNTTASSIEDINAYQHFGRTGLGSTNVKDDYDHFTQSQVYPHSNSMQNSASQISNFPETLSSSALSTSSSFVNMYGGIGLQQTKRVSPTSAAPASELTSSRSCSFLSSNNNNKGATTSVVPPSTIDFDYELDMPSLQDFFSQDLERFRGE